MRAIFISYRRNDSEGEAGRLFDDLVGHFGEDAVFMDVAAIEAGRDFRKAIDESVAGCGVLLAIIGTNWLDMKNRAGVRRLDDPSDFVRLETSAALRRDIPVIPVLVRGAKMPRPEQLPEGLVDLAYRNGVELTHARWNSDLQVLIKALDRVLRGDAGGRGDKSAADAPRAPASRQRRATRLSLAAALIALLAIGGYGAYYLEGRRESARLHAERDEAQRRAVQEEAAARARAEGERQEQARRKRELDAAVAKPAADRVAVDRTTRAAADKAEADRRHVEADANRTAAAGRSSTAPTLPTFAVKITRAACTDVGANKYRIEMWGTVQGDGGSTLYAGPLIPPNRGSSRSGKTACLGWRGQVAASDGSPNNRACQRGENETSNTPWHSDHVLEWRWTEPPDSGIALLYAGGADPQRGGRPTAQDRASFKCTG